MQLPEVFSPILQSPQRVVDGCGGQVGVPSLYQGHVTGGWPEGYVMAFHLFPCNISRGAHGGPERRTQVVEQASDDEERNACF